MAADIIPPGWTKAGLSGVGFLLALLASGVLAAARSEPDHIAVGQFSAANPGDGLPDGWQPLTFKKISRHTRYTIVKDNGRGVVRAVSEQSASGLTKNISVDPKEYPVIDWEWKVSNILSKGDASKKEGDDYPARIYVAFEYDSSRVGFFGRAKYEMYRALTGRYPPLHVINYIWGNKAPSGSMVSNPSSDRVVMFVVQSGSGRLNTWFKERRNVYQDYIRAFGQKPPRISDIAIMTDSDNTRESATAFFGDITFRKSAF